MNFPQQVKASSLELLNASGSWKEGTGLMHRKTVCFVGFVKNIINDHLIVTSEIKGPAQEQYHREDGTIGTASPHECLEEWSGYRQFLSHSFGQANTRMLYMISVQIPPLELCIQI